MPLFTAAEIDVPMDMDSVQKAGSLLGSAGIIVMDDSTCMVWALAQPDQLLPPRVVRPVHAVPRGHRLARTACCTGLEYGDRVGGATSICC